MDNNYLYYEYPLRKVTVSRSDFGLELTYSVLDAESVVKSLQNTKTIANRKKPNTKRTNKETLDIYDCLKKFSQKEILDESNVWFCEKCKMNQKAIKKIQLNYSPQILVIQLKRFKNGGTVKIDNYIDLELENYKL